LIDSEGEREEERRGEEKFGDPDEWVGGKDWEVTTGQVRAMVLVLGGVLVWYQGWGGGDSIFEVEKRIDQEVQVM
jgi:hypothetical protein